MGFFNRLKDALTKTRGMGLEGFWNRFTLPDDEFFEELEDTLVMADAGVETASFLVETLKTDIAQNGLHNDSLKQRMVSVTAEFLRPFSAPKNPRAILIAGVNGTGKTTTIGKLAGYYTKAGSSVLLAAGDTFRAAAAEQLTVWSKRAGVNIIKHQEGADAAAVVYDAIQSAKAKNIDKLIIDTAGRLHNNKNLMSELAKIRKIIDREYAPEETDALIVIDGTTGQNAVIQAKIFSESAALNGVIVTKLDGTAKGGAVLAVRHVTGLPVRFVGTGEGIDDFSVFDAMEFATALFD